MIPELVASSPGSPTFSVLHAEKRFSVCNIEKLGGPGDEAMSRHWDDYLRFEIAEMNL